MEAVQLKLDENNHGAFYIVAENELLAEMDISVKDGILTAYHTEVEAKAEGKGYAKQLLHAMTEYARAQNLKVIPLCPYVLAQFKRHPQQYADVWTTDQA